MSCTAKLMVFVQLSLSVHGATEIIAHHKTSKESEMDQRRDIPSKFKQFSFRESLKEPRQLLMDTMTLLEDETNENLPEGQLRIQVKDTLSQLEGFMKTIGCEF